VVVGGGEGVSTRILALVAHYGGDFPEFWMRPGVRTKRFEYLDSTLRSLEGFADRIVVGVQNDIDAANVQSLARSVELRRVDEPNPVFLPAQLCRSMADAAAEYELVYYTEDDQVLCLERPDLLGRLQAEPSVYLAPHRFTPVPDRFRSLRAIPGSDMHLARIVDHDGRRYAVENESTTRPADYDSDFYINADMRAAYGGAFLCSSIFFRSIAFSLDSELPTECTAGFDAFRVKGARALKTKSIFDFFVLHLSGWEFYERLTPPEEEGGEWKLRFVHGLEMPVRPPPGPWDV
jgi:hypothetical protein